jgi:hypothetical protein
VATQSLQNEIAKRREETEEAFTQQLARITGRSQIQHEEEDNIVTILRTSITTTATSLEESTHQVWENQERHLSVFKESDNDWSMRM